MKKLAKNMVLCMQPVPRRSFPAETRKEETTRW